MMRRTSLVLLLVLFVILAGANLLSAHALASKPNGYVFEDDFSGDELGGLPSKWTLTSNIAELGHVEVVADDSVPSGRALHFRASKAQGHNSLFLSSPYFGQAAKGAKKLAIEYWMKYVDGTAIYHYITGSGGHKLMFIPRATQLQNREGSESGNISVDVADLDGNWILDDWNRIRVIADRDTNEVVFYVNDMENPVSGSFHALRPIETWDNLRIRITHETHASHFREAYYSGFKVWVVE